MGQNWGVRLICELELKLFFLTKFFLPNFFFLKLNIRYIENIIEHSKIEHHISHIFSHICIQITAISFTVRLILLTLAGGGIFNCSQMSQIIHLK